MKPIGPLMTEHRLIERMVALLKTELNQLETNSDTSLDFVAVAVDFMRTYADRTHHGKEEDILFRVLAVKPLAEEHKKTMDELLQEHIAGRKMVTDLSTVRDAFKKGDPDSTRNLTICMKNLIDFYPAHIEKEDKHFFYPCLEYLSKIEQDDMLRDFWEFDRKLIHEKYQKIVEEIEKRGR